jgi:hypothetical protein
MLLSEYTSVTDSVFLDAGIIKNCSGCFIQKRVKVVINKSFITSLHIWLVKYAKRSKNVPKNLCISSKVSAKAVI